MFYRTDYTANITFLLLCSYLLQNLINAENLAHSWIHLMTAFIFQGTLISYGHVQSALDHLM